MIHLRYTTNLSRPNTFVIESPGLLRARIQATDVSACHEVLIESRNRLYRKDEQTYLIAYGFIHEAIAPGFLMLTQVPEVFNAECIRVRHKRRATAM